MRDGRAMVFPLARIVGIRRPALPASASTTPRAESGLPELEHAALEIRHLRPPSVVIVPRPLPVACWAANTGAAPTCAFWAKPGVEKGLLTCEPDMSAVISTETEMFKRV